MSKPLDAYFERSRRVTSFLVWILGEVDAHNRETLKPENAKNIAAMTRTLEILEAELKPVLWFISGLTQVEIDEAVNDGGQGND